MFPWPDSGTTDLSGYTRPLREDNDCHNPAGSPGSSGGEFCSAQGALRGPYREGPKAGSVLTDAQHKGLAKLWAGQEAGWPSRSKEGSVKTGVNTMVLHYLRAGGYFSSKHVYLRGHVSPDIKVLKRLPGGELEPPGSGGDKPARKSFKQQQAERRAAALRRRRESPGTVEGRQATAAGLPDGARARDAAAHSHDPQAGGLMRLEPNSGGTDEWGQTTVREIGWQPAARMAAIAARQLRARYAKKEPPKEKRAASGGGSRGSGSDAVARRDEIARKRQAALDSGEADDTADKNSPQGKRFRELDDELTRANQDVGRSGGSGGSRGGGGGSKAKAQAKTKDAVNATTGEREIDYNDGGRITVHKDGTATYRAADGSTRKGTYRDPKPKGPAGFKDEPEKKAAAKKAKARVVYQKPKTIVKYRRVGRQGPKAGEVPY